MDQVAVPNIVIHHVENLNICRCVMTVDEKKSVGGESSKIEEIVDDTNPSPEFQHLENYSLSKPKMLRQEDFNLCEQIKHEDRFTGPNKMPMVYSNGVQSSIASDPGACAAVPGSDINSFSSNGSQQRNGYETAAVQNLNITDNCSKCGCSKGSIDGAERTSIEDVAKEDSRKQARVLVMPLTHQLEELLLYGKSLRTPDYYTY